MLCVCVCVCVCVTCDNLRATEQQRRCCVIVPRTHANAGDANMSHAVGNLTLSPDGTPCTREEKKEILPHSADLVFWGWLKLADCREECVENQRCGAYSVSFIAKGFPYCELWHVSPDLPDYLTKNQFFTTYICRTMVANDDDDWLVGYDDDDGWLVGYDDEAAGNDDRDGDDPTPTTTTTTTTTTIKSKSTTFTITMSPSLPDSIDSLPSASATSSSDVPTTTAHITSHTPVDHISSVSTSSSSGSGDGDSGTEVTLDKSSTGGVLHSSTAAATPAAGLPTSLATMANHSTVQGTTLAFASPGSNSTGPTVAPKAGGSQGEKTSSQGTAGSTSTNKATEGTGGSGDDGGVGAGTADGSATSEDDVPLLVTILIGTVALVVLALACVIVVTVRSRARSRDKSLPPKSIAHSLADRGTPQGESLVTAASQFQILKSLHLFFKMAKSGFGMCFCYPYAKTSVVSGSRHLGCRGSQPKHVSNPVIEV